MIRDVMQDRPIAPRCSACGENVPECGRSAVAVVCAGCIQRAAGGPEVVAEVQSGQVCPDCGKARLKARQKQCSACRRAEQATKTAPGSASLPRGHDRPASGVSGHSGTRTAQIGSQETSRE